MTDAGDREFDAYEKAFDRGRYSESWLTKAVGYALAADEYAAGSFARTLVLTLEPMRVAPPARLRSTPEEPFRGGMAGQRSRRADLFLRSADGSYGLLIEAKRGAGCSWQQIPDYVRLRPSRVGLRADAQLEVALLATRSLALPTSRSRAGWLGCATWQEIVDELEDIQFSDAARTARWRALLNRYRHVRGFGTRRRINLPPASTLDSSVVRVVAAAREASKGSVRARAVPWNATPTSQSVVRKRSSNGASMRIELSKTRRAATFVEVHLDHPADAKASVRIVRWRGKRPNELAHMAVPKNAVRCREIIADQITRLVQGNHVP